MPFREVEPRRLSGSIPYGPFPIRLGRLVGSFAFLLVAGILTTWTFSEDRLVCAPTQECVITRWPGHAPHTFPVSALRDATVSIEHGSKNSVYGVVVLTVDGVGKVTLGKTTPGGADEIAARIRAAIAAGRPIDEAIRGPLWAAFAALATFAGWVTMAYSALKGLGRFRLELVRGGVALHVRRRVLGVPVSSYEVSLDGVTDVRVEPAPLGEMWLGRGEAPTPAARVVLVDRGERSRPITERPFPGVATHLRAASALRAALGLEPRRGGVEEQLAALPPITTPLGTRLAYSWIGVTVGGLLGLGVYAVCGLALGLLHTSDGVDGLVFAVGGGGGAAAGVGLALYLTRTRAPR